jgi:hypothetical protein
MTTTLPFLFPLALSFAAGWFLARRYTFDAATAESGRLHRAACNERACARLMRDSALEHRHHAEVAEARANRALIEAGELLTSAHVLARRLIHGGGWAAGAMREGRPGAGAIVGHHHN